MNRIHSTVQNCILQFKIARMVSCNNFLLNSSNAIYSRLFLPDIQMKRNRVHILSRGSLQLELLQCKKQIQEQSDYYYYYLNGSPTQ